MCSTHFNFMSREELCCIIAKIVKEHYINLPRWVNKEIFYNDMCQDILRDFECYGFGLSDRLKYFNMKPYNSPLKGPISAERFDLSNYEHLFNPTEPLNASESAYSSDVDYSPNSYHSNDEDEIDTIYNESEFRSKIPSPALTPSSKSNLSVESVNNTYNSDYISGKFYYGKNIPVLNTENELTDVLTLGLLKYMEKFPGKSSNEYINIMRDWFKEDFTGDYKFGDIVRTTREEYFCRNILNNVINLAQILD